MVMLVTLLPCCHGNVVTVLSWQHCYHAVMVTLLPYHAVMVTLLPYHAVMVTLLPCAYIPIHIYIMTDVEHTCIH